MKIKKALFKELINSTLPSTLEKIQARREAAQEYGRVYRAEKRLQALAAAQKEQEAGKILSEQVRIHGLRNVRSAGGRRSYIQERSARSASESLESKGERNWTPPGDVC